MEQLTQKLKSGEMSILEVPLPVVSRGQLLVRNHYSLISAGTEGSTVRTARKSLIGKANERPQQVKQVLDVLQKQGPVQTYRAVMKKLDAYSPLGYSSAGAVIEVGGGVEGFAVGDRVACAGVCYANHAEVVSVPVNLCSKLDHNANLKNAAYNTLGAIALQGVRQADLRLAETCAVVGLGLIGQLTCLMLKASGVRVVGIDLDENAVEVASQNCADIAFNRNTQGISETINAFSSGLGVDCVIITAGSSSLDPINFAGEICRKKGRVVVVGAVPTGFDRDPFYYRKELDLRMSCSYGPGRYDLSYEEKGIDYPAAYVRWTENRNMQAFQELIQSGKIEIDYLTTHEFPFEEASKAYDLILEKSEPYLGIVLKYDTSKPLSKEPIAVREARPAGKVSIGFIGAGSYAQSNLLPNLPKNDSEVVCKGVMTSSGTTSKRVAERFGFEFCTSEESDLLGNDEINTVFIATRHDSHADYVLKTLQAGKNVFVEKPLCLTEDELDEIEKVYASPLTPHPSPILTVGFNRRFSPLAIHLKEKLGVGPMSMLYRINAGAITADTWIQDMEIGGGRIIGEGCHFVDFLTYMCGSLPKRVYASALPDPEHLNDIVNINLEFENGSIGTISYFANGSKSLAKEYVEIHRAGVSGILRDFKEVEFYGKGKPERKKLLNQDKGQAAMVKAFVDVVRNGGQPPISPQEIFAVTRATFKVVESLRTHESITLTH
jgi:predicted dehydrogenase/threonine dehydrogenase-like Zn-dependent dehydrogenase